MNTNHLKETLLILFYMISVHFYGQVKEIKNAPSPEVANFGTFGSIPVGHYTGTPNISVPVYTMKVGSIPIPIEALYHTSNVKPHTPPSSLGIGWVLSAGGYIARNVKGIQDEKETYSSKVGYYFNHDKIKQIDKSSDKQQRLQEFTHITGNDPYELSADEFSFSFCGYNGTFFMDKDGQWRVISDDNIKVEFNEKDGFKTISDLKTRFQLQLYDVDMNRRFFDKFTLITSDGTRYEFGGSNATEYCIPYYNQVYGNLISTCWRLSKITTTDGRTVNFSYAADSFMCDIHYAPQVISYYVDNRGYSSLYNTGRTGYSGYLTMPSRLTEIRHDDEVITFKYTRNTSYGNLFLANSDCLYWKDKNGGYYDENNRYIHGYVKDMLNENRFSLFLGIRPLATENETRKAFARKITHDYLTNISILKSNHKTLDVNFNFNILNNRWLLSNIKFSLGSPSGFNKVEQPVLSSGTGFSNVIDDVQNYEYRFDYNIDSNHNNLWPVRNPLTFTDSWGYYSRQGSNPYNAGEWQLAKRYNDADFKVRTASLESTKVFVLKSITYPMGGKATFEYELNDYSKIFSIKDNSIKDESGTSGGLRIKKIRNYDVYGETLYSKEYTYKDITGKKSSGISKGDPCFYDRIYFNADRTDYMDFSSSDDIDPYPLNFNTPSVGYSTILEDVKDNDGKIIKRTRYQYTNYDTDISNKSYMDKAADVTANVYGTYASAAFTSMAFKRGKPTSIEVMDKGNHILKQETFDYTYSAGEPYTTVSQELLSRPFGEIFAYSYMYKTYANKFLVSADRNVETMDNGKISTATLYEYNKYGLPATKMVISDDGSESTSYKYSFEDPDYLWMTSKNILLPVSVTTKHRNASIEKKTAYSQSVTGHPYISKIGSTWSDKSQRTSKNRVDFRVEVADQYGNPVSIDEHGIKTVMIWSHKGRKMVAAIQNMSYFAVKNALGCAPEDISTQDAPLLSLDLLRTALSKALISTYEYDNRLNLIRMTEPNGMSHTYYYDAIGRLTAEYRYVNGKEELVKTYKYNYITVSNPLISER